MSILAACGPATVIENQTINYVYEPEVFQHCDDEPVAPDVGAKNRDWGRWSEGVRSAGQDCRDKVNGGREWQEKKRAEQAVPPPAPEPEKSWWKFW